VALILFTIQWFVYLSGIYNNYHLSISDHIEAEKSVVTSAVKEVAGRYEQLPELVLSETLLGFVLINSANELRLKVGDLLRNQAGKFIRRQSR